jgi:hypothetical protein
MWPEPPLNSDSDDLDVPDQPPKDCTFAGCTGTMEYHPARSTAPAPHTLAWGWRATFVCDTDRREDTPFFDCAGIAHRSWVLSDVPTDPVTLQAEVASVLTQCGCGHARHLPAFIAEELTRLVMNARADRESRLKMLPTAAPFKWHEMCHTSPWIRHGVYSDDARSIEVDISYEALEPGRGRDGDNPQPVACLVSTTPAPGRKAQVALSLDGLCVDGVVRTLEAWGWARQSALAVGRAVAIQARTDWLALLGERRRVQESRPRLTREDIERVLEARQARAERLGLTRSKRPKRPDAT